MLVIPVLSAYTLHKFFKLLKASKLKTLLLLIFKERNSVKISIPSNDINLLSASDKSCKFVKCLTQSSDSIPSPSNETD